MRENKPLTVLDWRDNTPLSDSLYTNQDKQQLCTQARCQGSLMNIGSANKPLSQQKQIQQARDFFRDYYADSINHGMPEKSESERTREVLSMLESEGTYDFTIDELTWGCQTAWRNAPRCPARMVWHKLKVFDRRHIDTAEQMFEAILEQMKYCTNGGNIQPGISIFAKRKQGENDVRVWNGLIMGYAAYQQEDGTIIGDPSQLELTQYAEKLGWKGKGGPFDFLPMVLSGRDGIPKYFEIPEEYLLRVKIRHATIKGINDMNLEWFGLPGVSSMMFEAGGIQFTGAPFCGWYQGTEVASRDFLDPQRYNLLEPLGQAMGLDMSSNMTLWRDTVALELNKAVLESFKRAGVSIVDHFTQADQFMEHYISEMKVRGGCPADWVWIVPPQSGSLCSTFHQEMINYHMSPSYEYQDKPWGSYGKTKTKKSFKAIAWILHFWNSIYKKMLAKRKSISIVYASETGVSKKFASEAGTVFSTSFRVNLIPMNSLEVFASINESDATLFVSSTFGNGAPPKMGENFFKELKDPMNIKLDKGFKFCVFGFGSTAYPKFCQFGKDLDRILEEKGGERMHPLGMGDEEKNQKATFKTWVQQAFMFALNALSVTASKTGMMEALTPKIGVRKEYRWARYGEKYKRPLNEVLSTFHNRPIQDFHVKEATSLHKEAESKAVLVELTSDLSSDAYSPGDHLGICPKNTPAQVNYLKERLSNNPPSDVSLTLQDSTRYPLVDMEDFPKFITFDDILLYFVDLRQTTSQELLGVLGWYATENKEREMLEVLSTNNKEYEKWKIDEKGICETLEEFKSVAISSANLISRMQLIKPRLYSIASSPSEKKVDLVIGVVEYQTKSGVKKKGLATSSLVRTHAETKIPGFLRSEMSFHLPADSSRPVIMICAGSGIAPFRGFWRKRYEQHQKGEKVGTTLLYFGCRTKSMDLLANETESIKSFEFKRITAFSREPGLPKTYVQDRVFQDGARVYENWIKRGGSVYVCGKIAMARCVGDSLKRILMNFGCMDEILAIQSIDTIKDENRYQEDIFG